MSTSKLMKVTYYDPKSQIRLLCYADTVVWDTKPTPTLIRTAGRRSHPDLEQRG